MVGENPSKPRPLWNQLFLWGVQLDTEIRGTAQGETACLSQVASDCCPVRICLPPIQTSAPGILFWMLRNLVLGGGEHLTPTYWAVPQVPVSNYIFFSLTADLIEVNASMVATLLFSSLLFMKLLVVSILLLSLLSSNLV